jgi:hypothetical protein
LRLTFHAEASGSVLESIARGVDQVGDGGYEVHTEKVRDEDSDPELEPFGRRI